MDDLFEIDAVPDKALKKKLRRRKTKPAPKAPAEMERTLAEMVFGVGSSDAQAVDAALGVQLDSDEEEEARGVGGAQPDDDDEDDEGDEGDEEADADEVEASAHQKRKSKPDATARVAAWVDEDDAEQVVKVATGPSRLKKLRTSRAETQLNGEQFEARLRAQYASLQPDTSWAAPRGGRKHTRFEGGETGDDDHENDAEDDADADEAADSVVRSGASLLGASRLLPPSELAVRRMTDLNVAEPCKSIAHSVQWHPNGQLALVAGTDKTVRLFRVDGTTNHKIQSIHVADLPITSASFSPDGSEILICGRGKHWCAAAIRPVARHRDSRACRPKSREPFSPRLPTMRAFLHLLTRRRADESRKSLQSSLRPGVARTCPPHHLRSHVAARVVSRWGRVLAATQRHASRSCARAASPTCLRTMRAGSSSTCTPPRRGACRA